MEKCKPNAQQPEVGSQFQPPQQLIFTQTVLGLQEAIVVNGHSIQFPLEIDEGAGAITAAAQNQDAENKDNDIDLEYLAQFGLQNPGPDAIEEGGGSNSTDFNPDNPGCFGRLLRPIINLKGQVVQLIAFLWGSKEDLDTKATRQRYKAQRAAKESMNKKLVELSIEKGLQLPQPSERPANLTTEQLLAESRRWRMRKTKLNSILAASTPELEDPGAAFDQPSDKL